MPSPIESTPGESVGTILHRLERFAESGGERPCVFYGEQGKLLTYAEFDTATDDIAVNLAAQGVERGDRVSTLTSNSLVAALSMFGIWKCGGVYCPISVHLNPEQLQYQLIDTSPSLLITDVNSLSRAVEAVGQQTSLVVHVPAPADHDFSAAQLSDHHQSDFPVFSQLLAPTGTRVDLSANLQDETAVIYTSGTTGPPKGVVQTHGWLAGLCRSLDVWTHADDVIYCDLPMHHIGGAFSMFARAIWCGASVSLWDRFSAGDFWHRINSSGVSIALLIDVMVNWILKQPASPRDVQNSLAKVHVLPLPANHRDIAQRFGFDYFIAGYGSSELGNAFSGFIDEFPDSQGTPVGLWKGYSKPAVADRLQSRFGERVIVRADQDIAVGYMGVSVGTYQPSIEDETGNELPAGHQGQLVLTPSVPGALFSGYLNKPEKTDESIVGGRFYSSDIVVKDDNGVFFFRDRRQGFIRVRGENVSAASVEGELLRHPEVFQAAVVSVPAIEGSEDDIAAFVVLADKSRLTESELHTWVVASTPKFMHPRFLRIVEELPVTTTMKVEKYKLRDMLLKEHE